MKKELSNQRNETTFEIIKQIDNYNNEFWSARDLSRVLEYVDFRNFLLVIKKAKKACKHSGQIVEDHFVDINEMVSIGSNAKREIRSLKLSRYACYLIVQNAEPDKEVVALGQTYFAIQTRLQEIQQLESYNELKNEDEKRLFLRQELSEHNKQLASVAKGAGVINPIDYAIFQNFGYKGLYGGLDAKGIKTKKRLKKSEQILDHMGSTELAANLFRATQTEDKIRNDDIKGKQNANRTHFEVGEKVRRTIKDIGGTMPENLPTEESIKKLKKKEKLKKLK